MHSPEMKEFIKEIGGYFWWVPESAKENLSTDAITEAVLNYGTIKEVKKLFDLVGIDNVAEIFYRKTSGFRTNYFPLVKNYFELYFGKYVSGYINKRAV
jgi:hypothetical protein